MPPQLGFQNHYVSAKEIASLAIKTYKKGGRGITYTALLESGLAQNKTQAQDMLKYHKRKGTLFTLESLRPQQYYPTAIKSDIIEKSLQKSTLIDPSGVKLSSYSSCTQPSISNHPIAKCMELVIMQSLEGYILPLLPKAPIFVHNIHLKTKVSRECFTDLDLPIHIGNNGKFHTEIIGDTHVDYIFYSSGTVNISTTCSKRAYKLETEEDKSRIIAFLGQLRDRLILLLHDNHERLVQDIMQWELTEFDVNKDIIISDLFHYTGLKIQVKHIDHLFRVYVKSMGKETILRVEQSANPNKSVIEAINEVFNPCEKIEKYMAEHSKKLTEISNQVQQIGNKDTTALDTKYD